MLIIPAIDLYDGKVVRLLRGDPAHSTIYSDDPIAVANKWKVQGATLIHIVDLSAALGQKDNFPIIKRILKEVDINVEVGGGIRDQKKAQQLLDLGAQRIIIGTKGTDEYFLTTLIEAVGSQRVAVSVDVIGSLVAICGWLEKTQWQTQGFIEYLQLKGIEWIIYTDIFRDGALTGPNLEEVKQFSKFSGINFIVSGGISSLDDIKRVKQDLAFVKGVIVGKALYEGKFSLSEAIACL